MAKNPMRRKYGKIGKGVVNLEMQYHCICSLEKTELATASYMRYLLHIKIK